MHTEVVNAVVSCTWRIQSRVGSSWTSGRVPIAARHDQHLRSRHLFEGDVDGEAELAVVGADLARFAPTNTTSAPGRRCSTS